jgi:hypothetical protein
MAEQLEAKEIYIKAHVRVIKQRSYRFVCKQCNLVSERICFPSQPLYCEKCRPPKPKATKETAAPKRVKSKAKLPQDQSSSRQNK